MKKEERLGAAGVTLVELLVAVSILSIAVLGFVGAFRYVSQSMSHTRARTLATNLAQEKIEMLKDIPYDGLLVTTSPATDTSVTPNLSYDPNNYPQETIVIGNITFTRETYVAMMVMSGGVVTPTNQVFPDSGMKGIQVNVLWTENQQRKLYTLTNLLENPNVNPLDSSFSGQVTNAANNNPMRGVVVKVDENQDWGAVTDANGNYSFTVYHGTYTLHFSSAGFYDNTGILTSAAAGNSQVVNSSMTAIASGTVMGQVWFNPNLVISEVSVSTVVPTAAYYSAAGYDVEYVELFNPTTYAINISAGPGQGVAHYYKLGYGSGVGYNCSDIGLVYVSSYVAPGHYYFIANSTSAVYISGQAIQPDAYYSDTALTDNGGCASAPPSGGSCPSAGNGWTDKFTPPLCRKIMQLNHSGDILLTDSNGNTVDNVGWENNVSHASPPNCLGSCINFGGGALSGMPQGEQIVRVSSPLATANAINNYGRAYDSQNNNLDFLYDPVITGIVFPPYNFNTSTFVAIAGIPAIGAYVAVSSDPFSGSTQAYAAYFTSGSLQIPYAPFKLVGIGTGTWAIDIASNTFLQQIQGIVITQSTKAWIPTNVTTPSWTTSQNFSTFLSSSINTGYIEGQITNTFGVPLNGIYVSAPGFVKTTNSNGIYFGTVASTGVVSIIVNPTTNFNPNYVQVEASVTVNLGQITNYNFILSPGGKITGYATTGTTPLASLDVAALVGGTPYGDSSTNGSGNFSISVPTGTYTVEPVMVTGESANPASVTAVVTGGSSVWVGTFTISGAFGTLTGNVTYNGSSLTTGALIIASQGSPSPIPPPIYASTAPALSNTAYAVSSLADGTYSMQARGGNGYNLTIYVPTISGTSVSVTTKTYTGVSITAGSLNSKNLVIP